MLFGNVNELINKRKEKKTPDTWRKFRKIRNESIGILKKSKQTFKDNLAAKIESNTLSAKDWWKTFKCLISSSKQDSLPPLHYNDIMINSQNEKADLFNRYFESQTQLDDKGKNEPPLDPPVNTLDAIRSTSDEVCSILKTLPIGK